MSLKIEIIRSVFKEIKRNFKYSLIEAEAIDRNIEKEKVKACELPFKSFMDKKGMSLQCSMALIYMLRRNGIKSFLGVYMGEGLYTDEQKTKGLDIADFLLMAETPQMALQRLIKQHPPLQHLIDSLGLVLVEES